MRCLVLADALAARGWRCGFAVGAETPATVPRLVESGHAVTVVAGNDPAALAPLGPCDLLVVDHYGLDAGFETPCRAFAGAILVVDDMANRRHDCDFLLDQNEGRQAADYAALVPAACHVLTGSRYTLLRPEFAARRAAALAVRDQAGPLRRVLVSMGMADPDDHTGLVLQAVAESGLALEVIVVLGATARHLEAVRARAAALVPPAEVRVGVRDMAALMDWADLAVGGAGSTTWERCCLGVPSLTVVQSPDQAVVARTLRAVDAALVVDGGEAAVAPLAAALRRLADPALRQELSRRSGALCDGAGAARLAALLNGDKS